MPADTATWYPSRYGAEDQAGALNEITSTAVVAAAGLVRQGRIYDLAHILDAHIPAFPGRTFHQHLNPPEGLDTANQVHWVVEYVTAPSQMGTHMDGLNHLHIGDRAYNGHRVVDIVEDYGTNRLGIETLPQVVTRGLLLDVAAARGVAHLEGGDVVTPADAKAALARQGLTAPGPGAAVLFHTGWGRLWGANNDAYVAAEPGPGVALAEWLVEHRVAMTGCDTWSFGPVPAEDPDAPFLVPQTLNAKHGVVVLENLRLAELAADGVGEFMFVVSHAKLRGATGAWVAPLAVI